MPERWRKMPGWPGYWQEYGSGAVLSPNGVRLAWSHDPKGYPTVTMYRHGRKHTKRVHVLQFATWNPDRKLRKGEQVRHLDGNKENCAAWNLKPGRQPEQERDKRHAGTVRGNRGTSRVKRGMPGEGSEGREKDWNRTEAYRAGVTRTSRTWPL